MNALAIGPGSYLWSGFTVYTEIGLRPWNVQGKIANPMVPIAMFILRVKTFSKFT